MIPLRFEYTLPALIEAGGALLGFSMIYGLFKGIARWQRWRRGGVRFETIWLHQPWVCAVCGHQSRGAEARIAYKDRPWVLVGQGCRVHSYDELWAALKTSKV